MIAFVRAHPDIHVFAGIALVVMAIALTVAILSIADIMAPWGASLTLRCLSAFGLFAAAFFLVSGDLKVGASGRRLTLASFQPWSAARSGCRPGVLGRVREKDSRRFQAWHGEPSIRSSGVDQLLGAQARPRP